MSATGSATARTPSYRLHKPSGRAVVTLDGRDHYLGAHGSQESLEAYDRLVAEWLIARISPTSGEATRSVAELILAYWTHAKDYYRKDGAPTSEVGAIKTALRVVRQLYGTTPAAAFGPLALKAVREQMVAQRSPDDRIDSSC